MQPVEQEDNGSKDKDLTGYNYNENLPLIEAIQKRARGAYWDKFVKILQSSQNKNKADSYTASYKI